MSVRNGVTVTNFVPTRKEVTSVPVQMVTLLSHRDIVRLTTVSLTQFFSHFSLTQFSILSVPILSIFSFANPFHPIHSFSLQLLWSLFLPSFLLSLFPFFYHLSVCYIIVCPSFCCSRRSSLISHHLSLFHCHQTIHSHFI